MQAQTRQNEAQPDIPQEEVSAEDIPLNDDPFQEPNYLDLIKNEFQVFKDLILNDESITLEETKNICDQVMNYIYGVLMISPLMQ